jgi:hypothetical protein
MSLIDQTGSRKSITFEPMAEPLTPLESAVLDLLLSRTDEGYDVLRHQLTTVKVAARHLTGAGFFTTLSIPSGSPKGPDVGNPLGQNRAYEEDVHAEIEGMAHGAGFLLWLHDGLMSQLEGFAYADAWPDEVTGFSARWEKISR